MAASVAAAQPPQLKPAAQNAFVPANATLETVWAEGEFTEGPALAADGAILFSDIGNRILRYDPASGETKVFREPSGRANGLVFGPKGKLFACEGANTGGGRRISVTTVEGKVETLADRYQGKRFNSPNDLAVTKDGRVYFTDPRYVGDEPRELDFEGVFLVEPDGTVKIATRELEKPNGIVIAPDGQKVYVADNNSDPEGNHHLVAFRVKQDGTLAGKKVLWDFGPNRRGIDGMTLDREGNIYATAGREERSGIYVFSPGGKLLALIATPGPPTNCVFGGKDRRTLYITAAAAKQADAPQKYALYRIRLKKSGYHVLGK